jgi:hypothetical protein
MATFGYNAANDATYKNILAGYQAQANAFNAASSATNNGYAQMINDNQRVGESDRLALSQQFERQSANAQQSAISRGMGNTNVLDSMQRGINSDMANATIGLNDSLYRRQTDLQNQQLAFQGQAAQAQAGIGMQSLGFQGESLGQRYGAEANYVSQLDLGNVLAKNQLFSQDLQAQYQRQQQLRGFAHDDSMRSKYGYF